VPFVPGIEDLDPSTVKSLVFRVATVQPCAEALAAITASRAFTSQPSAKAALLIRPHSRAAAGPVFWKK